MKFKGTDTYIATPELQIAVNEQSKITKLRLDKLLS